MPSYNVFCCAPFCNLKMFFTGTEHPLFRYVVSKMIRKAVSQLLGSIWCRVWENLRLKCQIIIYIYIYLLFDGHNLARKKWFPLKIEDCIFDCPYRATVLRLRETSLYDISTSTGPKSRWLQFSLLTLFTLFWVCSLVYRFDLWPSCLPRSDTALPTVVQKGMEISSGSCIRPTIFAKQN